MPVFFALLVAFVTVFSCLSANSVAAQSWCSASRLNPTEATICTTPFLGQLDTLMQASFDASDLANKRASQSTWLQARNACGVDVTCISDAYITRLVVLDAATTATPAPTVPRRPWCRAAGLNLTEQTICASDHLANLDAAMAGLYGDVQARTEDQTLWLRRSRNMCGADATCIARAYVQRIGYFGSLLRLLGQ